MSDLKNCVEKQLAEYSIQVFHINTCTSTNIALKDLAVNGTAEGSVVIADRQTAGRGRFARKFYSPEDTGIYMSLLLRPGFSGFDSTLLTPAAAAATAKAVEIISGKKTMIKWVNDVLIDRKKISGILVEGAFKPGSNEIDYIIVGIGVNAFPPSAGFDSSIKDIAGAVFEKYDPYLKIKLITEIIKDFMIFYKEIDRRSFLDFYRKHSIVIGKSITVIKNDRKIPARALDLDDNCRLLVEYENHTQELLSSGEVSIKMR